MRHWNIILMHLKQGKKLKPSAPSSLNPIHSSDKQPRSLLKEEKSKIVNSAFNLAKQTGSIAGRNCWEKEQQKQGYDKTRILAAGSRSQKDQHPHPLELQRGSRFDGNRKVPQDSTEPSKRQANGWSHSVVRSTERTEDGGLCGKFGRTPHQGYFLATGGKGRGDRVMEGHSCWFPHSAQEVQPAASKPDF